MRNDLDDLLARAKIAVDAMTPAEREKMIRQQAESWARGMAPCEHGIADWEDCPDCRRAALVETIVAAALKIDGTIITCPPPARHGDLIRLYAKGREGRRVVQPAEQGFITSAGCFVDRLEAMQVAVASGQLQIAPREWLASEDLW